jgi:DMSO/TMAO reductase YedYZ heme-binding membrane subunit
VSLLFSYGCFLVLYYLHYLLKTPAVADVFFIYYIVTFIATVVMSLGLVWVIKRTREINERQTTRKELALFFYK